MRNPQVCEVETGWWLAPSLPLSLPSGHQGSDRHRACFALLVNQTWYLAVDMQLFLVMPLLVLLFVSHRTAAYATLVALWAASVCYGLYLGFHDQVSSTLNGHVNDDFDNTKYMVEYYLKVRDARGQTDREERDGSGILTSCLTRGSVLSVVTLTPPSSPSCQPWTR